MKCKIRNLELNYEVYGKGKPIVLIHGYYPDHRLMTGCFEPLFNGLNEYKRIYIDLPGMGKSESNALIKSSDTMLDIVIDFIDTVIPDENFLLAGESYGGYLSRGIVYKIGHRVDGLLLLCPLIVPDSDKRNVPLHTVLKQEPGLLNSLSPSDAEEFNSMAVVQTTNTWDRYNKEIMPGLKLANDEFLTSLRDNGYTFSFNPESANTIYDKPTLMLLGRQDSSVGYKDAWDILDHYPRASFCILDMAGHNLQIEQDALFDSLVTEWLSRSAPPQ